MPVLQLYLKDEQEREDMKDLAQRLDTQGIDLRDNRGHLSLSKLIRFLVEAKREELESRIEKKGVRK